MHACVCSIMCCQTCQAHQLPAPTQPAACGTGAAAPDTRVKGNSTYCSCLQRVCMVLQHVLLTLTSASMRSLAGRCL
jgi:hypothetical protein